MPSRDRGAFPSLPFPDSPPNNSTMRDNICYRGLKILEKNPPADLMLDGDYTHG